MLIKLTSALLLVTASCTVGAVLPYSVHPAVTGDGDGDGDPQQAVAGRDDAPAACVRDHGGRDFASATKLGAGDHRGCVETKSAVYAITAPADNVGGALYEFAMTAPEQICVTLYDQQRKQHGGGQCIDGAATGKFWAAVAPGTTIYLRLERTLADAAAFRLDVSEKKLVDDEEPNSTTNTATPLALGEEHHALMQLALNDPSMRADVYKVVVPRAGTLDLALDPGSDEVEAEAVIFDSDRRKLADEHAENPGAILRMSKHLRPGTYYVQVGEFFDTIVPYGIDGNGETEPTGHFTKPYRIAVDLEGKSTKRVSRR
jgi:hypothetical protein